MPISKLYIIQMHVQKQAEFHKGHFYVNKQGEQYCIVQDFCIWSSIE